MGTLGDRSARRWLGCLGALCLAVAVVTRASAQGASECRGGATHAPETTDYVVVIDDSGSMKHTDPGRLAVLAARVFAELVGESEQVAVFGMGALARAQDSASWATLVSSALERGGPGAGRRLGASGGLAEYPGQTTPCRSMLTALQGVLNHLASRGARRQVVLLLTDGHCEGTAEAPVQAEDWLRGVTARQHLRLYLVPFKQPGRTVDQVVSEGLWSYVARTSLDGRGLDRNRFAVSSGDARRLVEVFAQVLADSRGYALPTLDDVAAGRTFESASRVSVLRLERLGSSPPPQWNTWQRSGEARYGWWHQHVQPPLSRSAVDERALIVPDYGVLTPSIHVAPELCPKASLEGDAVSTVAPGSPYCVTVSLMSGKRRLHRDTDLAHEIRFEGGRPLSRDTRAGHWRWDAIAPAEEGPLCLRAEITLGDRRVHAEHPLTVSAQALSFATKSAVVEPKTRQVDPRDWGSITAGSTVEWTLQLHGKGLAGRHDLRHVLKGTDDDCVLVKEISQPKLGLGEELVVTLEVPRDCRSGQRQVGTMEFSLAGMQTKASFSLTPVPLPTWQYWGPLVLRTLGILLGLVSLGCWVRGFLVPARRLPPRRRELALFYARSKKLLTAEPSEFKRPDEMKGAIPVNNQFGESGWYQNARLRLGPQGNVIRARVPKLLLEILPDRVGSLVLVQLGKTPVYRVSLTLLDGGTPEEYLSEVLWQTRPTLDRQVGWPCRWYAKLGRRMPAVPHTKVADGEWFQFGSPAEGELYIKVDRSPYSAGASPGSEGAVT